MLGLVWHASGLLVWWILEGELSDKGNLSDVSWSMLTGSLMFQLRTLKGTRNAKGEEIWPHIQVLFMTSRGPVPLIWHVCTSLKKKSKTIFCEKTFKPSYLWWSLRWTQFQNFLILIACLAWTFRLQLWEGMGEKFEPTIDLPLPRCYLWPQVPIPMYLRCLLVPTCWFQWGEKRKQNTSFEGTVGAMRIEWKLWALADTHPLTHLEFDWNLRFSDDTLSDQVGWLRVVTNDVGCELWAEPRTHEWIATSKVLFMTSRGLIPLTCLLGWCWKRKAKPILQKTLKLP